MFPDVILTRYIDGMIVNERPTKINNKKVVKKIVNDASPMLRCCCSGRGIRLNAFMVVDEEANSRFTSHAVKAQ